MHNLHHMVLVYEEGEYVQVNHCGALYNSKEDISFFWFHSNLNASLLDNIIVKATMQPLKLFLKIPQYIRYNDTKYVEFVV